VEAVFAVYCVIDVGKGEHHAVGLGPTGKRLYDKALPNDEAKLRAVFTQRHNSVHTNRSSQVPPAAQSQRPG
jgi:hypothetical protein